MALEVVQLRRLRENYAEDEYIIVNRHTEKAFSVIFTREDVAMRACEVLSTKLVQTVNRGAVRQYLYFWKKLLVSAPCAACARQTTPMVGDTMCPRCSGTGTVMVETEVIDRPDEDFDQIKALIDKEIDEQIGFDRTKDCPDKPVIQNGVILRTGSDGACQTCPYLRQEDVLDDEFSPVGKRWLCSKLQAEVKAAERLMDGGQRA